MIEKIQGCLLGVQIGDALGMPVETMTHSEIMQLHGGRGVVTFMDPVQRKIKEMINLKAGQTTDDWQLTQVVAESIIASGRFNVEDCAERHVNALATSTFGWGKTTQRSIEDIRDRKRDLSEPPPIPDTPNAGCGNGIIMKVAPVAILAASNCIRKKMSRDESLDALSKMCMDLCFITHPDPRAGYAAFAVAIVIHDVLLGHTVTSRDVSTKLLHVITKVKELERKFQGFRFNQDSVSGRLERLFHVCHDATLLREAVGCGFTAMDTAAFTIGTFFRHPNQFKKGVLEAVNAGGDTDTNASIVGAMIGAQVGTRGIPLEWSDAMGATPVYSTSNYLLRAGE